jgi:hypothetical protein
MASWYVACNVPIYQFTHHKKTGLSVWMAGCEQSEGEQARKARHSGQVIELAFLIVGRKASTIHLCYLHHMIKNSLHPGQV